MLLQVAQRLPASILLDSFSMLLLVVDIAMLAVFLRQPRPIAGVLRRVHDGVKTLVRVAN